MIAYSALANLFNFFALFRIVTVVTPNTLPISSWLTFSFSAMQTRQVAVATTEKLIPNVILSCRFYYANRFTQSFLSFELVSILINKQWNCAQPIYLRKTVKISLRSFKNNFYIFYELINIQTKKSIQYRNIMPIYLG